jgi:hypothetical protein
MKTLRDDLKRLKWDLDHYFDPEISTLEQDQQIEQIERLASIEDYKSAWHERYDPDWNRWGWVGRRSYKWMRDLGEYHNRSWHDAEEINHHLTQLRYERLRRARNNEEFAAWSHMNEIGEYHVD